LALDLIESGAMLHLLAGNPEPQTSPVTAIVVAAVLVLLVGGAFGLAVLAGSGWHKGQVGARQETRAEPVAVSWPVRMRREGGVVFHGVGLQDGRVSLRGGFIEVVNTWSVGRALNRGEFYFLARETHLAVESGVFDGERLVISGFSGGQPAVVWVTPGGRVALEQMWHALIAAGASRAM
jgi:hypothetical protein